MITILCAGSRGDFQPYIALAQSLKKLNEEVKIVGFAEFETFVKQYGIDYVPIEADYKKLGVDPQMLKQARSADNPLKMLLTFNKMKKYGIQIAEATYNALEDSDLIVYHPGCTLGYFAAKEMNIPAVLASPFPMNQTNDYLSVISYGRAKPTALNIKLSYKMLQSMLWLASSHSVKHYWKQRFNRRPLQFKKPYECLASNHPAIISASNFVFSRPKDWNALIHQSGYWFVEELENYTPSKELDAFLTPDDKPIYIGFGSVSSSEESDDLVKLISEALDMCGKRAIISGMGDVKSLPKNMIAVHSIPHTWLFERVSVVCHHGGAGTTAAGFKAGVPSVIIPFSNDQFAWAHRAYDLGVAAKPVYKKELTASRLAQAINEALEPSVVTASQALGANLATEQGAMDCAKVITQVLHS